MACAVQRTNATLRKNLWVLYAISRLAPLKTPSTLHFERFAVCCSWQQWTFGKGAEGPVGSTVQRCSAASHQRYLLRVEMLAGDSAKSNINMTNEP